MPKNKPTGLAYPPKSRSAACDSGFPKKSKPVKKAK